jgi:phage gp36-like protein
MALGDGQIGSSGATAPSVSSGGYCEQSDLESRISRQRLTQLTNDITSAASPDPAVVTSLILHGYDVINSKLGVAFVVPFVAPVPGVVKRINTDLACYYAMQRRFSEMDVPSSWQKMYDDAMEMLDKIAEGTIDLGAAETAGNEGEIVAPDKYIDFEDSSNPTSEF